MIALDTNVLVGFLTQDDPVRTELANTLVAQLSPQKPGFVSVVVVLETFWVLRKSYGFSKEDVLSALSDVCLVDEFEVENSALVQRAIASATSGADFADALIFESARRSGASELVTFDRKASQQLGATLLQSSPS